MAVVIVDSAAHGLTPAALDVSGSDTIILAAVASDQPTDPGGTVTRDGQSFTKLGETGGVDGWYIGIWRLINPNAGSVAVIASDAELVAAVSLSGVSQSDPEDALDIKESADTGTLSSDPIVSAVGDMVFSFAAVNNTVSSNLNPDIGGLTKLGGISSGSALAFGWQDGAASVTAVWEWVGFEDNSSLITVNVNASVPPPPAPTLRWFQPRAMVRPR